MKTNIEQITIHTENLAIAFPFTHATQVANAILKALLMFNYTKHEHGEAQIYLTNEYGELERFYKIHDLDNTKAVYHKINRIEQALNEIELNNFIEDLQEEIQD